MAFQHSQYKVLTLISKEKGIGVILMNNNCDKLIRQIECLLALAYKSAGHIDNIGQIMHLMINKIKKEIIG